MEGLGLHGGPCFIRLRFFREIYTVIKNNHAIVS